MVTNMEKLMAEIPSPNVTAIHSLDFDKYKSFTKGDFSVLCHKNGIFEFRYNARKPDFHLVPVYDAFGIYQSQTYNVNVTGCKTSNFDKVGSVRFCTMNYNFASILTNIIKDFSVLDIIKDESGDWLEMVNVSQYFRFMMYKRGGEHFPHWDTDFAYDYNGTITKYSVVVYFTDNVTGEIAFVDETNTEFANSTLDWTRQATDEEIYLKINPSFFKIVAFPHTLCHTVLPFQDKNTGDRIICRGDILYRKCK